MSVPLRSTPMTQLTDGRMKLVQAWIEIHRDELMADWELAVNGQEVFKIEPLK